MIKVYDVHYIIDGKVCYKRYIRANSEAEAEEMAIDPELLKLKIEEKK